MPDRIFVHDPDEDARFSKRTFFLSLGLAIMCLLTFAGGTVFYVSWSVNSSEHKWCSVIDLLDAAPPPTGANSSNPSREYEVQLSNDFHVLKGRLGC